jgi:hypothetical protein
MLRWGPSCPLILNPMHSRIQILHQLIWTLSPSQCYQSMLLKLVQNRILLWPLIGPCAGSHVLLEGLMFSLSSKLPIRLLALLQTQLQQSQLLTRGWTRMVYLPSNETNSMELQRLGPSLYNSQFTGKGSKTLP